MISRHCAPGQSKTRGSRRHEPERRKIQDSRRCGPAQNKIHEKPVPRGGGVVIFLAFAVAVLLPGYRSHGMNGIMGTLSVGLFAVEGGLFYGGGLAQLGVQALGVASAIAFVFPVSYLMFTVIKAVFGLRVSPEVEAEGIDMTYHGVPSYPEFLEGAEGVLVGD